ncbi:MAG: ABC transporter substrate-binding protein [Gemmatales bacterium]|nr:ABC transporter substrate-binding protein [Gemmatales bacterium]MDW8386853.1 ABC transporter substrate-binding protein [Gemmatales bacterium]
MASPVRSVGLWIGLAVSLLALAGCHFDRGEALRLVILSPHREEIRQEVATGFQEWLRRRPGYENAVVRIEWRDIGGGSSQMLRYLDTLYRVHPEGVGIDLLFGGGTDPYLTLKENKRLEAWQMPSDLRAKIPQNFSGVDLYDPEGYWHGVMISSLVIFINREAQNRLGLGDWKPMRWRDLGHPRLQGHVTAGDPRMSGSVRLLYDLILQTYGWDEGFRQLMRLGANARGFARFSDSVTKDVVFGRAVAGGSLDSYAFSAITRERLRGDSETVLEAVFPYGETLLNPDSIGILKGAPNRRLAELFVEYNLSEDGGQRLWMLKPNTIPGSPKRYSICRLSVMPGLYDPQAYPPTIRSVPINPFEEAQVGRLVQFNNRLADNRRYVMSDLFGCWIVDTHAELSAAWQAILRSRSPDTRYDPLEERLFAPPCSEAEAMKKNAVLRPGRPVERAEQLTAWIEEARMRYKAVREEALARLNTR